MKLRKRKPIGLLLDPRSRTVLSHVVSGAAATAIANSAYLAKAPNYLNSLAIYVKMSYYL